MNRVALVLVIAVLLVVLIAVSSITSSAAQIAASKAAIEAARAAQVAAGGQAVSGVLLTLTLLAVVLTWLAALTIIAYSLYKRRWAPGPNAYWRRTETQRTAVPRPAVPQQPDPLQQLVQLEMLRYLRDGQKQPPVPQYLQQPTWPRLPVEQHDDHDGDDDEWGLG